jgi:hypothetical protein
MNVNFYRQFNFKQRSWWKLSSVTINNSVYTSYDFNIKYLPMADNSNIVLLVNYYNTNGSFNLHYNLGATTGTNYPNIVTKKFNTNPSDIQALTQVILYLKGSGTGTLTFKLYDANDTLVHTRTFSSYAFPSYITPLLIDLPAYATANMHSYYFTVSSTNAMYLYNIERRFRTRGRTR